MTRAIALTCTDRPNHLDRLLTSLAAAPGAERWPIVLGIEPGDLVPEIEAVAARHRHALDITTRVNAERLGIRHHPAAVVEWALGEGAEVVLLLEDDLCVAPSALSWCDTIAARHLQADDVLGANLLTTTCNSESIFVPHPDERAALSPFVVRTRFFSSIGLLFRAAQWDAHFRPNWFVEHPAMVNWWGGRTGGWDVSMVRTLTESPGLTVLQSLVPRVTHEGVRGTNADENFQARSFDNVTFPDEDPFDPAAVRVVDVEADLFEIPTAPARMYLNLARQLWSLQHQLLRYRLDEPAIRETHYQLGLEVGRRAAGGAAGTRSEAGAAEG